MLASPSSMLPKSNSARCCAASVERHGAHAEGADLSGRQCAVLGGKVFVRHLLELLLTDGHVLRADGYVVEEARRNLAAKVPAGVADAACPAGHASPGPSEVSSSLQHVGGESDGLQIRSCSNSSLGNVDCRQYRIG